MFRALILTFVFCFSSFAFAKDSYFTKRVRGAQPGDYIVAKQPGCYCLLILRAKDGDKIILEEIDVPEYSVDLKTMDWKTWLLSKAPGNSSWGMISIDLGKKELLEAYSVTKRSFLTLSKEEQFFLELLSLPSERLMNQDRRKIGPPPLAGEEDHRSLWLPKVNFDGKIRKDPMSVYRSVWPKDGSILSSCKIDFYFDEALSDFPFPVWIDIYGGYFQARLAVIEAGRGMVSPARDMPKRPPKISSAPTKENGKIAIEVECTEKFEKFELFALDASGPLVPGITLPHELRWSGDKIAELLISQEVAQSRLQQGHRYRLGIRPAGYPESYFETEHSFLLIDNKSQ